MYRGRVARTRGDHDARRRDVSVAVWRVLTAHGFGGLTLRAVAAELGATTGLVTHYFRSKDALLAYALDLLTERTEHRPRRGRTTGLAALRAALLDMLPLGADSVDGNRIWVSSWDTALADHRRTDDYAGSYARSRTQLAALIADAQRRDELPQGPPEDLAASVQSFVLGLTVQALFDPTAFPPERQIQLLDNHLATLRPASLPPEAGQQRAAIEDPRGRATSR
jgi:AcrR family transcriptional regulator